LWRRHKGTIEARLLERLSVAGEAGALKSKLLSGCVGERYDRYDRALSERRTLAIINGATDEETYEHGSRVGDR
jgi:hypothetical protein